MVGLFVVVILRLISEIRRPVFVFVCFGVLGLATVISLPLLVDLIFINDSVSFDSVRTSGRITIWQTLFDYWPSGVGGIVFGAGGGGARDLLISDSMDLKQVYYSRIMNTCDFLLIMVLSA